MSNIFLNFQNIIGKIKPMHAVNNGPVSASSVEQSRGNFDTFKAAKIPYARNHDASFFAEYGGEHTVDVHAIFPDFTKNPYDERSYDFTLTDEYTQTIVNAGTEVFYRFGSKIEHWTKKYGTIVPADFHKWAVICEHIIRHYTEGWANGFHHKIEYLEIWNEPDGIKADGTQPNWSGTPVEFYELYTEAATHLKKRFPHLKIGGPAVSWLQRDDGKWTKDFLAYLTADGKRVPLDFFSWHGYTNNSYDLAEVEKFARQLLNEYGYTETESILNEYNYIEDWTTGFVASIESIIGMHGAAFTSSCMALLQASTLDMLMYYDARPDTVFNGMFDFYTMRPLKGYYPFVMFSELYELGNSVECSSDDKNIMVVAAKNDEKCAVMLTHYYKNRDNKAEKEVTIHIDGVLDGDWQAEFLDENRTMEKHTVSVKNGEMMLAMPNDCVVLLTKYIKTV